MKKLILLMTILSSIIFTMNASAAVSFKIEQSLSTEGVFNVLIENDTQALLRGWTLGFGYDPTELLFKDYTNTPIPGFMPNMPFPLGNPNPGILNNLNAFGFDSVIDPGTYQIASFTFEILANAKQDGKLDFWWNLDDPLFSYYIDGVDYRAPLGNLDQKLNRKGNLDIGDPIPVPSSLLLLGGGICALFGVRRKSHSI